MRAGGYTLSLLGTPRTARILKSLAAGKKGRLELRRDAGSPAESTLRGLLGTLEAVKAVVKNRRDAFPGTLEYEMTQTGRDLHRVAGSLERWLASAPRAPIELGSGTGKAAIKGLVEGWSASVLTSLASGPLSLTELDKRIVAVSYPTLERCLDTMRLAEQLDMGARGARGTPYTLTDWLRRGLTPLAVAARWEHRHEPDGADSIDQSDIDGALMLGGPLFEVPGSLGGVCQLAVRIPEGKPARRSLAFIQVREGKLTFHVAFPQSKPDAWASGTADTWFAALMDADTSGLRMSGNRALAAAVFDGVREALFKDEA